MDPQHRPLPIKKAVAIGLGVFLALSACSSGASSNDSGPSTGTGTSAAAAASTASNESGVDAKGVVVRKSGESYDAYIARLYEAATKEGSVDFLQSSGQSELDHMQTQWKQLFPKVELKPITSRSGSYVARAMTEERAGDVKEDVVRGTIQDLAPLGEANYLEQYSAAGLEKIPEAYRFPGPYVSIFFLTRNVAYNTEKVKAADLPTDWMGYCDAKWKGQITFDPDSSEVIAGIMLKLGEEKTVEFLKCLAANDVRLIQGTTAGTQAVASGEAMVKLDGMGHVIKKFEDKKAPVTAQVPNPDPLVAPVGIAAILKGAPHPNAARLLQEFWLMKDGGQAAEAAEGKPSLGMELHSADGPYPKYMEGSNIVVLEPKPETADLILKATELMKQYLLKQ